MNPQDIDKLFKERLGNTAPTPPADLWNRLQERMQETPTGQEEVDTKVIALTPAKNKPATVWLYSSIAAAVSLVLSVGVVFYNIHTGTPEVQQALADKSRTLELHEKPVAMPTAAATLAQTDKEESTALTEENISVPQATEATSPASNKAEGTIKQVALAKADVRKSAKATAPVKSQTPQATVQQAIAQNKPVAVSAEPVIAAALPVASVKADANLNAAPVEITITRSVAVKPANPGQGETPTEPGSKATLAKNIFKQVRNLASGENVELSELGINADKVALHTQIGNQKFSKVINL